MRGDFSGGLVVKTLRFHCRGMDLIPGWETKFHMPYAAARKKYFFRNKYRKRWN